MGRIPIFEQALIVLFSAKRENYFYKLYKWEIPVKYKKEVKFIPLGSVTHRPAEYANKEKEMRKHLQIAITILATAFCLKPALAQPLSVEKIEPPNWWVGMKNNSVQLMLYGKNLQNIGAEFNSPKLKVSQVHTLANPDYAFLDIDIAEDLSPGTYALTIRSDQGTAVIEFPVLSRNTYKHRHAGFGPQDVVYLITPDRFANGNPLNDRAEDRFNEFDPCNPSKRHGGDLKGIIDRLDYLKELGVCSPVARWL